MEDLAKTLIGRFGSITRRKSADWPAFNVPASRILDVCRFLRDDFAYDVLIDITAIDWEHDSPRFSVVYHLLSSAKASYVRLVCPCVHDHAPSIHSVESLWPAANWHEREAYDMFGIHFEGHPELKRILMWDDYPYHPLRKEFPLAGIDTDLPLDDKDIERSEGAKAVPAPMMGGPFHATPGEPMSHAEPHGYDESWTEKHPKPEEGE